MEMQSKDLVYLEKSILKKTARSSYLRVDIKRLRYVNSCLYSAIPKENRSTVLNVGVGHGHDAILALLDGSVANVLGVDPYIATAGNSNVDYQELLALIDAYDLADHFAVERNTIENYLDNNTESFDLIILSNLLHHVFVTEKPLSRSDCFSAAVELFKNLAAASNPGGMLVISDAQRHGIRPFLSNLGVLKGSVDYQTKQSWSEWNKAVTRAGWALNKVQNYIPYGFRKQRWLWSGAWGRHTLCHQYFLFYDLV
jgi:SAM-dependent methyltransferase